MWKLCALMLLLGSGLGGTDPIYNGPVRLGSFSVKRPVPIKALVKEVGPVLSKTSPFCFSYQENAFLRLSPILEQPESAGEILISDFPNCSGRTVAQAVNDFREWKTGESIGLGSLEKDVTAAYGKPTAIQKPNAETYTRLFRGTPKGQTSTLPVGESVLLYNGVLRGMPNSWTSSRFGIRNGKVAWIMLTIDD
jgi:hypothetical protein